MNSALSLAARSVRVAFGRPTLLLSALALCISTNFQILLSVVPVIAERNGPHGIGGAATAALSIGAVIGEFSVPWLMTRYRPRNLLIAGELLTALGSLAYFLNRLPTWLIISTSSLRGLGMGFAIVVSVALLADLTHADRRGAAIGSYGLALSLPSIFVPSLGVYLLSFGRSDLDALIATVAAGIGAAIALRIPGERNVQTPTSERLLGTLRQRRVLALFFGFVLASCSFGGIVTYVPIVLPLRGPESAATFLLIAGASRAIARWVAGPLGDRRPVLDLLAAALGATLVGVVLLALHQGAATLYAAGLAYGAGYGAIQTGTFLAMSRVAPRAAGAISALWNSGTDLGSALGGIAVGLAASQFGYPRSAWTLPVVVLLAAPLFFVPLLATSRVQVTAGKA